MEKVFAVALILAVASPATAEQLPNAEPILDAAHTGRLRDDRQGMPGSQS